MPESVVLLASHLLALLFLFLTSPVAAPQAWRSKAEEQELLMSCPIIKKGLDLGNNFNSHSFFCLQLRTSVLLHIPESGHFS